jgi:hypothetical protein
LRRPPPAAALWDGAPGTTLDGADFLKSISARDPMPHFLLCSRKKNSALTTGNTAPFKRDIKLFTGILLKIMVNTRLRHPSSQTTINSRDC